jgi:DNA-binding response OmpR family regulator
MSDNRSKIIVAIDDAPENLSLLESAVTAAGYSFIGEANGEAGLQLLVRVAPRLILLDIQMPGMDGFEVCRRMRAYRHLDKVPVIFLTARKTVEDVRACMAAGGNDFMVKPFDVEKLQARIRRWVATRLPTG